MDLKLADSVLAIVSFAAGSIVPVVYRRLAFEDLSLKQAFDFRAVLQDKEGRARHQFVYSTVVKAANSSANSVIIDDVHADPVRTAITKYECVGVDLKMSSAGEGFRFPLQEVAELDYLPLLVKANLEVLISLGLWFRHPALDSHDLTFSPIDDFMAVASGPGIAVRFRINGKYRKYLLRAKPFERWTETKAT